MASSKATSSVIDFGDSDSTQAELQFQDFSHDETTAVATLETTEQYTSFPNSPDVTSESAELLGQEKKPSSSFWEFKYYQNFFDVDTDQVVQRIIGSVLPMPGRATYLDRLIRPNPDLYGPFWISTTLVFSVAISANIAEFFMTEGQDKVWHYDLHKVSLAATAIYSYVFLLPFALWGFLWYRYSTAQYTLLEVLCVYGYSLFIYIPLSILLLIQVSWLQWTLVLVGAALSGTVLAHTFWPIVSESGKKLAVVLLCVILLFHTLLAVGFVAYFFRPPQPSGEKHVTTVSASVGVSSSKPVNHKLVSRNSTETELPVHHPQLETQNLVLHTNSTNEISQLDKKIWNSRPEAGSSTSDAIHTVLSVLSKTS